VVEAPQYPPGFSIAVARLLRDEGGYVDNPDDPGGETRFGISRRSYPDLDIRNLTREAAIAIYFRDWWRRYGYERLPEPVAAKLFDLAVDIGPGNAAICLQRACRANGRAIPEAPNLGPRTIGAARELAARNPDALLAAMRSEFAGYYRAKTALDRGRRSDRDAQFLRGWLNRAYE
jgi:lysozyme family protein